MAHILVTRGLTDQLGVCAHRNQCQPAARPHVKRDRRAQPQGLSDKWLRIARHGQLSFSLTVSPIVSHMGPSRCEEFD